MYSLLKDIFNPKNWIKLLLNPKKIKIVYDRMFYYPGLKFGYSRSYLYKKILIKSTIFFARRNKKFKEIFFSKSNGNSLEKIYFQSTENILDEAQIESLNANGILVLENVLNDKEHKIIQSDFNEYSNSVYSETVKGKSSEILMKRIDKDFNKDSYLTSISNIITKKIYGKLIQPTHHYMYSKSINIPEKISPGDNIMHVDRFLPNLKLIYFPFNVGPGCAPFRYALGSHKINNNYLDFFINNKSWIFDERNSDAKQFLTNIKEIPVKENSLVIALTNGFHSRTPFKEKTERAALFFNYPKFNLLSLMLPKN